MAKDPGPSDQNKPKPYNTYLKYSGLAIQLVLTIGVAGWLGHLLDNYLNLRFPLFIVLFTIAALVAALYQVYRSTNQR